MKKEKVVFLEEFMRDSAKAEKMEITNRLTRFRDDFVAGKVRFSESIRQIDGIIRDCSDRCL